MKIRLIHYLLSLALIVSLMSCSDSDTIEKSPNQAIPPTDYTFVHFDPTGGPAAIALPNEILRSPTTGLISIPPTGDPAVDGLAAQVNTIPGFSTSAAIRIPMVGKVNADSVNSQTVIVVDAAELAAAAQGAQVNPFKEYVFEVKDDETGNNSVIMGMPVRPLTPGHPHLVVVTQGVIGTNSSLPVESEATTIILKRTTPLVDAAGNSLSPALSNEQAQALEPLRAVYQGIWGLAEQVTGTDRVLIPFSFLFTTQPLYGTLAELRNRAKATPATPEIVFAASGAAQVDAFFQFLDAFFPGASSFPHTNIGAVVQGVIPAPNYMQLPVNDSFKGSGADVQQFGTTNLNFMAALPPGEGPFPTMIFQHGITSRKEFMLGVADGLNANGIAVVAIDLFLHGDRVGDFFNNETGLPGPDGLPDDSGTGFINLLNLLSSRDNIRQSVADLFYLTHMISSGSADFNGDGNPELAPAGTTFLGMSLGAIVGTPFVAMEPDIKHANLNVGGARVPYLLQNSEAFGPAINAGLGAVGLAPGTALYDIFFLFAQTINDDADPFNYAPHMFSGALAGGVGTDVLIQEMIGDTVVPNSATEDQARAMGIAQVDATAAISGLEQVTAPYQGNGLFQFDGGHGALILPTQGPTAAIQTQSLTFLLSALSGTPTVINPFTPPLKKEIVPATVGWHGPEETLNPHFLIFNK